MTHEPVVVARTRFWCNSITILRIARKMPMAVQAGHCGVTLTMTAIVTVIVRGTLSCLAWLDGLQLRRCKTLSKSA